MTSDCWCPSALWTRVLVATSVAVRRRPSLYAVVHRLPALPLVVRRRPSSAGLLWGCPSPSVVVRVIRRRPQAPWASVRRVGADPGQAKQRKRRGAKAMKRFADHRDDDQEGMTLAGEGASLCMQAAMTGTAMQWTVVMVIAVA